ncbi:MAG TPA: deoxyhypusine synthase [Candidatus Nanoarchaeia archaeon]|nr:deoxyhypusine synthase [Candidatus Nanoarchaeia archaeon]
MTTDKYPEKSKEETARKNVLRRSQETYGVSIKGYDFNKGANYDEILDSYSSLGLQASNLSKAVQIINLMIKNKAYIYLGYTSNLVTSGLRDIFRYLAEHKKVDVIVTTTGGVEEDIIKCLGDFKLGDFRASGKELRERGINRAGNIFIPNSRYCDFEDFIMPIFDEIYQNQKKTGEVITPSDLIWKLGEKINNKESIYYWCWKNKIPVFCPAITDGSLGDMIYFFKSKNSDFKIDVAEDIWKINNTSIGKSKTGIIVLGEGIIKHHICNANMFRNGADYAVYINTVPEYDGSDSGALPEEAVSWGKILPDADRVKVYCEASLIFPLIVAKTFANEPFGKVPKPEFYKKHEPFKKHESFKNKPLEKVPKTK